MRQDGITRDRIASTMNKVFNFENVAVGRALKMINKTVWMMDLVFSFETEWYNWRQDSVGSEQGAQILRLEDVTGEKIVFTVYREFNFEIYAATGDRIVSLVNRVCSILRQDGTAGGRIIPLVNRVFKFEIRDFRFSHVATQ